MIILKKLKRKTSEWNTKQEKKKIILLYFSYWHLFFFEKVKIQKIKNENIKNWKGRQVSEMQKKKKKKEIKLKFDPINWEKMTKQIRL